MKTIKKVIVDPPNGWQYGFPKIIPVDIKDDTAFSEWLFGEGYPQDMIPLALKYSRYWEEEFEVDE